MNDIITVRNLNKKFRSRKWGNTQALNGLSFSVKPGQIIGVLGPNGAGKTTMLKSLLGLTRYDGEVEICGLSPRKKPKEILKHVCFIADVAILPKWLSAGQAIEFVDAIHPKFNRRKAQMFLEKTQIKSKQLIGKLSRGMIVQLHLALIMAIDVDVLVLDEPTLGLDILYRKQLYDALLHDYYNQQRTIIIATHQIDEIENILTDVMIINQGQLVLYHSVEDLDNVYSLITAKPNQAEALCGMHPLYHYKDLKGEHFLFKGKSPLELEAYGTCKRASISDIYLAEIRSTPHESMAETC